MVHPHLVNYVREQLKAGYAPDEIRTFLVGHGYPIRDIDEALEHARRPIQKIPPLVHKKVEDIHEKARLEKIHEREDFIDLFKTWFMTLFMPGHVFPEEKNRASLSRSFMNVLISASLGGLIAGIIVVLKLIFASPSTPFIGVKLRRNISMDDLKVEIKEAEKLVSNFGNINLKALEVYDVLEKEHKELVDKGVLLDKEKGDILNMMAEIEGKKKRIFIKTFREISDNFKRIFLSLSTKGDAYLDLEDKENPLNGGLNIKVKITGTKFLDLHSLSGGEKTLTALAFIFAIQEYEPASFYLLDEVDAALDKTNSQLLSKLIGKYSKNSQYIMISHNDSVITEAEQIYGVSMQQNGISKVISMKL